MDHKAKAKAAWQRSLEVVSCKNYDYFLFTLSRIRQNGQHNYFWA